MHFGVVKLTNAFRVALDDHGQVEVNRVDELLGGVLKRAVRVVDGIGLKERARMVSLLLLLLLLLRHLVLELELDVVVVVRASEQLALFFQAEKLYCVEYIVSKLSIKY